MTVPDKVLGLVERFERNLPDYKRGKYNETQVRREFIDPFFKALGWDIDNEEGYAEAYKGCCPRRRNQDRWGDESTGLLLSGWRCKRAAVRITQDGVETIFMGAAPA